MIGDIARVHMMDIPYYADKLYDYFIPPELIGTVRFAPP